MLAHRFGCAIRGAITTEGVAAAEILYPEEYHQQYLPKNPNGYCGIVGCGSPIVPEELAEGQKA